MKALTTLCCIVICSLCTAVDDQELFTKNRDLNASIDVTPIDHLPVCEVTLNATSALYLRNSFEVSQPSFARLQLNFHGQSVLSTDDVILPFQWIWSYYDMHSLASYLKWPTDFSLLSFGLLDAKTLPAGHFIILEIPDSSKCRLKIGEYNSTKNIAKALTNFTQHYLLKSRDESNIEYSYWCYLAEVPNRKNTLSHRLRLYTSYPMEMAGYRCCHTKVDIMNKSIMNTVCDLDMKRQNIEASLLPYAMSVVAFVFFPIFLLRAGSSFMNSKKIADRRMTSFVQLEATKEENDISSFVYLDGTPPISFTTLLSGFCGLVDIFPIAVSRFRRFLFIGLSPCLIFIRIFIYRKYMYAMVLAMLKHDCSLGFLSMLGGFSNSRRVFLTALGGPYVLLGLFYLAGIFFVIIPEDMDMIFELGSERNSACSKYSPLFFTLSEIEQHAETKILDKRGYAKAASLCSSSVLMILNPKFWYFYVRLQLRRFVHLYFRFRQVSGKLCNVVLILLVTPLLLVVNVCETAIVIALYGFPVINFIHIYIRGFTKCLMTLYTTNSVMTKVGKRIFAKLFIALFVSTGFIYFVFSFCTIFTETFVYIAKTLFFSFLSVIVFPSTSFGYLFFGIVLVFYLLKSVTGFGEVYLELLADAVELSLQLEENPYHVQYVDDVLVIDDFRSRNISKVQIQGVQINLSYEQRKGIRESQTEENTKVDTKDHIIGIPRDLFEQLVKRYRPVHVQIAMTCLKIFLIVLLIVVTFTIISRKPLGSTEDISEVMHVVFLMAIGALPKILEVALNNMNHSVKREIQLRKMKADIEKYWRERDEQFIT